MLMRTCHQGLAVTWVIGAIASMMLIFIRTVITDFYGQGAGTAVWGWYLPCVMPTFSLVLGSFGAQVAQPTRGQKQVDSVFFWISIAVSCIYLLALFIILLVQGLKGDTGLAALESAGIFLGPFQGIVAAMLGIFFGTEETHG